MAITPAITVATGGKSAIRTRAQARPFREKNRSLRQTAEFATLCSASAVRLAPLVFMQATAVIKAHRLAYQSLESFPRNVNVA